MGVEAAGSGPGTACSSDAGRVVFLSSGQTGVERGAAFAALDLGLAVAGTMPCGALDEMGSIPRQLAKHLVRCTERGFRPAVQATIDAASAVIVAVPDARRTSRFTGMTVVTRHARTRGALLYRCDPGTELQLVARSLVEAEAHRIYITGPRASRWTGGEALGRRLIRTIASILASDRAIIGL